MESVLKVDVLNAGKTGKRKDLGGFHGAQIGMLELLDQTIATMTCIVGCPLCAVVGIYRYWSKKRQLVNQKQGHGHPRLTDTHKEPRHHQADGGSVMLWATICWKSLGPGLRVNVTLTRAT